MRKLVFFDVDGTLISYSTNPHHIPEPTLEALRLLKEQGYILSLSTGRSLATAGRLMGELGIDNAVLCGGAHVIAGGKTISATYINEAVAEAAAHSARDLECAVFACTEKYMYAHNASEETEDYVREHSGCMDIMKPLDEMKNVCLINIYGDRLPDRGLFSLAGATFTKGAIEMRPHGVSKASGVRLMAGYYGIAMEDTIAVGDGDNDIEMLWAANIGIAVGNGTKAAKNAANIVALPIDEGGIYKIFKKLELI